MKIYLVGGGRWIDESIGRVLNQQISNALVKSGIGVWSDARFDREIRAEIRQWMEISDVLILIWSEGAYIDEFFRYHWDIALKIQKRVIVIKLGEAELPKMPDHFNLLCVTNFEEIPQVLVEFFHSSSRYNLFISYSRQDEEAVSNLLDLVEISPHAVWVDKSGLDAGDTFPDEIFKAIEKADRFLLLWSKRSRQSRWVEQEWNYAYKLSKEIIPILLDSTQLPMALEKIDSINTLGDKKLFRFLGIAPTDLRPRNTWRKRIRWPWLS